MVQGGRPVRGGKWGAITAVRSSETTEVYGLLPTVASTDVHPPHLPLPRVADEVGVRGAASAPTVTPGLIYISYAALFGPTGWAGRIFLG